jgi:hypothetical protein
VDSELNETVTIVKILAKRRTAKAASMARAAAVMRTNQT